MKIVSACLAGIECRYDCKSQERAEIIEIVEKGEAIPVCPEQLGGLSTPRIPAEIQGEKVINKLGEDVSSQYEKGANQALKIALLVGATKALLKSKSPMCGVDKIYDGKFSGTLKEGQGIFTKLLQENNIETIEID